ncbi:MAG: trigger factor [Bdellovibrionota bacterium]
MKTSVENVSTLERKLNVSVPPEVVKQTFEKAFETLQKHVSVKGFRKGKAPVPTLRSMYGDQIKQDVVNDLIQSFYPKALMETKLQPISNPEFEFEDPAESKEFAFSASFDVRPEIKLKKYEGLAVQKEAYEFDEKKVDQVLENIRASRASLADVLEDRAAQNGDTSVVNFKGFVDGAPLENGTGENYNLELGTNSFIQGFEEAIVGMKIGGKKRVALRFPEAYHVPELAGKPVEFDVELVGLKKKVLPELTPELLESLGGPTDVDGLKDSIRKDLQATDHKRIDDAFKNRLLKKLVEENPVDVPASLLRDQKAALVEDFKKRMKEQGMGENDFAEYVNRWNDDFTKTASDMIQSSFLVTALAEKLDLLCKDEDLEKKFAEYAQQTGIEPQRIKEFYSKPEQTSRLTYIITEEKVVKFLTDKAKIQEVPASALPEENA